MTNAIHNVDFLQLAPEIAGGSAGLIIADPPYNIGEDYGDGPMRRELDDWLAWSRRWLSECRRILADQGNGDCVLDKCDWPG